MSSVPSLAAAGSGGPGVMPLFTPPQTPGAGNAQPVAQAAKREAEASGEEQQGGNKKRRIAPTPVMDADGVDVSSRPGPPKSEGQGGA